MIRLLLMIALGVQILPASSADAETGSTQKTTLADSRPEQFSLAVRERPSARQGNKIQIDYASRTVFEGMLPTARGNVRAMSEYAVEAAYEAVSNAEAQRLLFHEPDLAADEF